MTVFSVWAPHAKKVEVCLEKNNGLRKFEMDREDDGWFFADVEPTEDGDRYGFALDGGKPMPDPRSPSQPDGVHKLSALVDHDAFAWTDRDWRPAPSSGWVIYELHIGTFTEVGTFESAIDKLDHLVDLGVNAIELLPVVEFPGDRGWGYDGVSLFAPHRAYGGPDGLKALIDASHARGLAVIIDAVYNHLGPDGNYLWNYGPYFTDTYSTPWGSAVNYDERGSDEVRRFVIDNALMWLRDYHADGLRLDAVHAIYDKSATHVLEALNREVDALEAQLRRPLTVIAESDLNDPVVVTETHARGWGFDAQWSDDFHHALHQALTGEKSGYYADYTGLDSLVDVLENNFAYIGQYSPSRDRSHGRSARDISATRFVAYLQNHDQIGNRATGDRISKISNLGRAKVGSAILLFSPFIPMLFQGEEFAAISPFQYFTDHNEELGRLVSEGRKREFGHFGWDSVPDPQSRETFENSKLSWSDLDSGRHQEILDWYKSIIAMRRDEADLNDMGADLEAWTEGGVVSIRRGALRLVANLGPEPVEADDLDAELVLASDTVNTVDNGVLLIVPDSVAIIREG